MRIRPVITTALAVSFGLATSGALAGKRSSAPVLVSIGHDGSAADGNSWEGAVTPNGRFAAFSSDATNLLPEATSDRQIFVHNLRKGATVVASRTPAGEPGNDASFYPSISKNGRFVVFESLASDLVEGDTNGVIDIFVADLRTGAVEIVSRAPDGSEGNGHAYLFGRGISDNGRWIVFATTASNLTDDDTNGGRDIFLHDRVRGTTVLVSRTPSGAAGNGAASEASISPNGRFIVFDSNSTDLTDEPSTGQYGIFLYDVRRGTLEQVTRAADGGAPDRGSYDPVVSNNGRWVGFYGSATNLVDDDTNGRDDVFLTDRRLGTTRLISRTPAGASGNNHSQDPAISANGKVILFYANATDLVTPDDNGISPDLFRYDPKTGAVTRLGITPDGGQGDDTSYFYAPSLASNGRWLQFTSTADNLVDGPAPEGLGSYVMRVR